MKKRSVFLPLVSIVSALMLSGCFGPGEGEGSDSLTITVMGRKSDLAKSYMTSIFAQYEKATGNRIEPVFFEDTEFETSAAESFSKGEVPDIFMHFHNADLDRFDFEENFMPLNDQAWVDELTESSLAYCMDDAGNVMGLPYWENSVSGCYYNKTILDDLGLRPATTQSEFDILCEALAETGNLPICWPAAGGGWMVQFALDPVFADDPELLQRLNRNEVTYADIPQVTDMVQWIADAADRGWLGHEYLNWDINDVDPVMSGGQAVMTFMWDTWFYTDLAKDGRYTVDDFALMPVFLGTEDGGTYEGGNLNMMMVNKNGGHVDACLEFLTFCATAENYNVAFDGISTVNCFKGQTTNIQSPMITNAAEPVEGVLRASTAASRIKGYSDDDVAAALDSLFRGKTDVAGCVALLDEYRIARAHDLGVEGF